MKPIGRYIIFELDGKIQCLSFRYRWWRGITNVKISDMTEKGKHAYAVYPVDVIKASPSIQKVLIDCAKQHIDWIWYRINKSLSSYKFYWVIWKFWRNIKRLFSLQDSKP